MLTDIRKAATSARAREQRRIAKRLAEAFAEKPQELEDAFRHLAAFSELDPEAEVRRATATPGLARHIGLASWIAGADLQYAKDLLGEGQES